MSQSDRPIGDMAAAFVADAATRRHDEETLEAARKCIVDTTGVAVGARAEPIADVLRRTLPTANAPGPAPLFLGGRAAALEAALINGTMAHALDFDDTHVGSVAHLGAPVWAAVLSLGAEVGASEAKMTAALITGFELGARAGGNGIGEAFANRGWHATAAFGRLGAAAAAAVLLGLDAAQSAHALGAAITQIGGLTASFGTMSKPFHAGKAAMDGILAARLAANGFAAATDLFDHAKGLPSAVLGDGNSRVAFDGLGRNWEIARNTFKPYASCLLTHPGIDAARRLAPQLADASVSSAHLRVHPLAVELAGKTEPRTELEGKFSLAFCIALGLRGHRADARDFVAERIEDPGLRDLAARITVETSAAIDKRASILQLRLADGRKLVEETEMALGNPENPMGWDDMAAKFDALVRPVLGPQSDALFTALRHFDQPGRRTEIATLLDAAPELSRAVG